MSLDFCFIKFTNYADDLLKGKLYLNSLEYYRGIERILNGDKNHDRNDAINDYLEGSVASINKKDFKRLGIDFGEEITNAMIGNMHLLSEDLKYLKILCLYAFLYDVDEKIAILPSEKIYQFGSSEAVIILDTEEFRKRIIASLNKNRGKNNFFAFEGHFIDYYEDDEKTKMLGPFNKRADFWWQHEFRLVFREKPETLEPSILEIGDISDIAKKVKVDELMKNPQNIFPDYKFISEAI